MNPTERLIWTRLRGRKVDGWKFRRQQPIGPYFVDFYCPAARLAVEIDGPVHWEEAQESYDERRQAFLEAVGCRVLRISVSEISRDLGDVIDTIDAALQEQEQLGFKRRPSRPRSDGEVPPAGRGFEEPTLPRNGGEVPGEAGGWGRSADRGIHVPLRRLRRHRP